jgi:hypothetical protein
MRELLHLKTTLIRGGTKFGRLLHDHFRTSDVRFVCELRILNKARVLRDIYRTTGANATWMGCNISCRVTGVGLVESNATRLGI